MISLHPWRSQCGHAAHAAAVKALPSLGGEESATLPEDVLVYTATLKAREMLWSPSGFLVAQRCLGGLLNYGIRKSFYTQGPPAKQALVALASMPAGGKKSTSKLDKVVQVFA